MMRSVSLHEKNKSDFPSRIIIAVNLLNFYAANLLRSFQPRDMILRVNIQ
jgi:hypothetical protein